MLLFLLSIGLVTSPKARTSVSAHQTNLQSWWVRCCAILASNGVGVMPACEEARRSQMCVLRAAPGLTIDSKSVLLTSLGYQMYVYSNLQRLGPLLMLGVKGSLPLGYMLTKKNIYLVDDVNNNPAGLDGRPLPALVVHSLHHHQGQHKQPAQHSGHFSH